MASAAKADSAPTREIILAEAVQAFAEVGYSGVSMRDIARAAAITPAAIYHHFPDKDALYLAAVKQAFNANTESLLPVLEDDSSGNPEQLFRQLVEGVFRAMSADPHFRRIYMREILDADEGRLQLMADEVLFDMHHRVKKLLEQLAPEVDSHLVMISLAGLVLQHLETTKLAKYMPDAKEHHMEPETHAKHIADLILRGILK